MNTPTLDTTVIDLGRDKSLMTDAVAADQLASVNRLLSAFFSPPSAGREVQLLADEVGLGKTFVALGVAYATLAGLRESSPSAAFDGLADPYRAVVVITPQGNHALAAKWRDEVGLLVKRCGLKPEALAWFKSGLCETPEDLIIALRKASDLRRKPGSVPTVLVCEAGMFTRRIRESGAKLRFLAATLFQWLGIAVPHETRRHVVRRAAEVRGYEDWAVGLQRGENVELWDFTAHERFLDLEVDSPDRNAYQERRAFEAVPFRYTEMYDALNKLDPEGRDALYDETPIRGRDGGPRGIVPYCKWVAERHGQAEMLFDGFKMRVSRLYRDLFVLLMARKLPLVIADEAHHWRRETEGCRSFMRYLAPFTHRLLLLSATPFQLCGDELGGMLSRADGMAKTIGDDRVRELAAKRDAVLKAMKHSEQVGLEFSRRWGRLADDLRACRVECPQVVSSTPDMAEQDRKTVEAHWQTLEAGSGTPEQRLQALPGRIRPFFAAARELRLANAELGRVMRELVIRHRRDTTHRRYRVGGEYPADSSVPLRPDYYQLHAARGRTLPPDAELAQFLLMKVVASATRGRRKTALGMDVTGAYSTLWSSKEGKKALAAAAQNGDGRYFNLLRHFTGGRQTHNSADRHHPKVTCLIEAVMKNWERDEKTLIFCFRLPTAHVLRDLVSEAIDERLKRARQALLRGRQASSDEAALEHFRGSLTSRTGSVLPAFMDRVLMGLVQRQGWAMPKLDDTDLQQIAELAARAHSGGSSVIDPQKPDRVLLFRICEHVLALKCRATAMELDQDTSAILERICSTRWIETRYALDLSRGPDDDPDSAADVRTRSALSVQFELSDQVDAAVARSLLSSFRRAQRREGLGLLDALVAGPNVFVPLPPFDLEPDGRARAREMTDRLWEITLQREGMQWGQRGDVVDAVNRALLRDHFLLRMPRDVFAGNDESWSEALVRGYHSSTLFSAQREPVAQKVAVFLQGLAAMTIDARSHSLRYALNPQGRAVVLVSGANRERDAVFRGFNSPLLPEILICTEVGQEGIDLHRHCRHVVHYDLGWNPAKIEQRTGRVDRIGSKAQRERAMTVGKEDDRPGLEIGLPYLAATYDERMFDRLFHRAQAFDLLTGGDPSADPDDDTEDIVGIRDHQDSAQFVALPTEMRNSLRVDLRAARS